MHLCEILGVWPQPHAEQLFLLKTACSDFLRESKGLPVFKHLTGTSDAVARVKIRHKANPINQYFGESVLRESNGGKTIIDSKSSPYLGERNFWMFPTNGYKYLYGPNIHDYKASIRHILEHTSDQHLIREMVQDMHVGTNLVEGIASGAEILWYGISSYYAVDCSSYMDYNELLNLL